MPDRHGEDDTPMFEVVGICHTCIHQIDLVDMDVCTAFPEGIPTEFRVGKVLHTKPYPGDHGIQYDRMLK